MKKITIKNIAQKAFVSPSNISKITTGKYKEDKVQICKITIDKINSIVVTL